MHGLRMVWSTGKYSRTLADTYFHSNLPIVHIDLAFSSRLAETKWFRPQCRDDAHNFCHKLPRVGNKLFSADVTFLVSQAGNDASSLF